MERPGHEKRHGEKERAQKRKVREKQLYEKEENIIGELDEEKGAKLEEYMNEIADLDAEAKEEAYLGGGKTESA